MTQVNKSELPIYFDENTYALSFEEGLTCSGSSKKVAGQMKNLLATRLPIDEQEQVYEAYRDIIFEKDRNLFNKYDFRYDITVILPGEINGESKKTSGHYHGSISKQAFTYPEIYQVLEGDAAFVLQKVKIFNSRRS
jgi:glucose-6-phosphate isomerase